MTKRPVCHTVKFLVYSSHLVKTYQIMARTLCLYILIRITLPRL
nr:MAG TPA: hypothetical protein [Caudoviricetes sp.]